MLGREGMPSAGWRRKSVLRRREAWEGRLCILPWLLGFVVFTAGPMLASAYFAFTKFDALSAPEWIGLGNFVDMVTKDDLFWISLYNTAYYTFLSIPLYLLIALCAAMALNVRFASVSIFRTVYYLPSITPSVASAILWLMIFQPDYGLLNTFLTWIHLPTRQWLFDPRVAKLVFVIMGIWGIGNFMVIFLAGLQSIPEHLYEAAAIDGAGWWARLRHVTLPMLSPIIFFNLVIGIIGSFQVFTAAYIITDGGPVNSTLFYVLYLWNNAFQFFEMGYASALAWVLFVVVLIFTFVQFKLANRWVYYEGDLRSLEGT